MTHWASPLIGRAWSPTTDCWWLFREAWLLRWGEALPDIRADFPGSAGILRVARVAGARAIQGPPADGDAVVMRSSVDLHIGMAVELNHRMGLLDSVHGDCVRWTPWEVAVKGYDIELWRKSE